MEWWKSAEVEGSRQKQQEGRQYRAPGACWVQEVVYGNRLIMSPLPKHHLHPQVESAMSLLQRGTRQGEGGLGPVGEPGPDTAVSRKDKTEITAGRSQR